MKLKKNVALRFVLEVEERNRIVEVYSLLIKIDKRISKSKNSSKKVATKKQKEDISLSIGIGQGSRKKRAYVILKTIITSPYRIHDHDRYYYTDYSSCSLSYYEA